MKNYVRLNAFERTARATYPACAPCGPSDNQVKLWVQQASICNQQLATDQAKHSRFQVIPHKTGIGKTHALSVYAAELACTNHTLDMENRKRMVIAVREKTQADEMVDRINIAAGENVASSHYTGHHIERGEQQKLDILVVTHEGIASAIASLEVDEVLQPHQSYLISHSDLIVFDEAPEALFRVQQLPLNYLRHLKALSSLLDQHEHREAIHYVEKLVDTFENSKRKNEELLWTSDADCPLPPLSLLKATHFLEAIKQLARLPGGLIERAREQANSHLLTSVRERWVTLRNDKGGIVVETAQFMWPQHLNKPVVLDATGDLWQTWRHMSSQVNIARPVAEARSYHNVTLHVQREKGLGKSCTKQQFENRLARIKEYFANSADHTETLFVSHKDHLGLAKKQMKRKKGHHYAYWFAIDGKNHWVNCTRVVITSLPYTPPHAAKLKYWAATLPKSIKDELPNDLREHEFSEIAGRLVQAINRSACRSISDEVGGCQETDIYTFLPAGLDGDRLIDLIKKQMPGIQVKDWIIPDTNGYGRIKSVQQKNLIDFMKCKKSGSYTTREIGDFLGWTKSQLGEVHRALSSPTHCLPQALKALGVSPSQSGRGRSSRWTLSLG
jgi:stringent starvation protein B